MPVIQWKDISEKGKGTYRNYSQERQTILLIFWYFLVQEEYFALKLCSSENEFQSVLKFPDADIIRHFVLEIYPQKSVECLFKQSGYQWVLHWTPQLRNSWLCNFSKIAKAGNFKGAAKNCHYLENRYKTKKKANIAAAGTLFII